MKKRSQNTYSIASASPGQTARFAARISRLIKPGSWLGLRGELGSGKTTFVQGLAAAYKIKDRVQSPTFVIMREYSGLQQLVHIDLYRLSEEEALHLGLEELTQGGAIVAVEWPEKLPRYLREAMHEIRFLNRGPSERDITVRLRT